MGILVIAVVDADPGPQNQENGGRAAPDAGMPQADAQAAEQDYQQRDGRNDDLQGGEGFHQPVIIDTQECIAGWVLRGQQPVFHEGGQHKPAEHQQVRTFPVPDGRVQDGHGDDRSEQPPSERDDPQVMPAGTGHQRAERRSQDEGYGIAEQHFHVALVDQHQQRRDEREGVEAALILRTVFAGGTPDHPLQQNGQQRQDQGAGQPVIEELHQEFRQPVCQAAGQRKALEKVFSREKEQLVLLLIGEILRVEPHPEREHGRAQQAACQNPVQSVHR